MSSTPAAFLLTFYFYFLYYFYNSFIYPPGNIAPYIDVDVVILGVIGCSGIIAGLVWLIRLLLHLRASQHQARQQPQKLEEPLVQKVHNRPRP